MKRISILTLALAFGDCLFAQQNVQKLAERGDVPSCVELARQDLKDYKFEKAQEWLTKAETTLKKKKLQNEEVEQLKKEASKGDQILRGTDRVLIIDSLVVDKADFLKAYQLSEETGSLDSYAHFFTTVEDGSLYMTELGNRIYYGKRMDDGSKRLCTSEKLADGSWGEPIALSGVSSDGSAEDYPFLFSDGTTLYFASEGRADGLGGYDIYVTRATEGTNYLKPENLGMPYNSPYNDYMMVIDEVNQLGWFASDRYQPAGMVCIYIFVPNESRHPFDVDNDDPELIRESALLKNIKVTQTDASALNIGKQHLKEARLYRPETKQIKEFELVIDDGRVYSSYAHFKNSQAAMLCKEWVDKKKQLINLEQDLDANRLAYSKGKKNLAATIRQQETQQESLTTEVHQLEKQVRNLELK